MPRISQYLPGIAAIILFFVLGYLAPYVITGEFFRGAKVSVIGPIENQNLMNEAIAGVQALAGKGFPMTVEQQAQGAIENQYVVSIDGTLEKLDGEELRQVGFILTVDKNRQSIFWSSVTESELEPEQYYALFESDLQGKMRLKSISRLRE